MTADISLAMVHHLLVFSLAGVIAAELALVRAGMGAGAVKTLGAVDASYGVLAVLILIVGFARVFMGAKGAAFYLPSPFFWTKIAAFAVVGFISITPTVLILKWRGRAKRDGAASPPDREVALVRRCLIAEVLVGLTIPVWAALMARGVWLQP
jgi:putative membrane protein